MSKCLPEICVQIPVNAEMVPDDLPDLICEECGVVVGWDNVCGCEQTHHVVP